MENNKQLGLTIKQKDGLAVIIKQKPKRYQVTESNFRLSFRKELNLSSPSRYHSTRMKRNELSLRLAIL